MTKQQIDVAWHTVMSTGTQGRFPKNFLRPTAAQEPICMEMVRDGTMVQNGETFSLTLRGVSEFSKGEG